MGKKIKETDYIKAVKKADRDTEIALHGKQISMRGDMPHKSKKAYNRQQAKAIEDDEVTYSLSERSLFVIALYRANLLMGYKNEWDAFDDETVTMAFKTYEKRMIDAGFVSKDDGTFNEESDEDPRDIFMDVINGFFPNVSDAQARAAFYGFAVLMEEFGRIKKD